MCSQRQFEASYTNLMDWLSISGAEIRPELENYFELYRERFVEIIEVCNAHLPDDDGGVSMNEAFISLFEKASTYNTVGDFLSYRSVDYALVSAFGLVLFDRLNERWDELSKQDLFFWHEQLFECFELGAKKIARKEEARSRALKGHATRRVAKNFVVAEWEAHRSAYNFNKSAFARDYVRRVLNEHGVKVTEKQLREVWLLDALPASKPDGLHSDG